MKHQINNGLEMKEELYKLNNIHAIESYFFVQLKYLLQNSMNTSLQTKYANQNLPNWHALAQKVV